LGEGTTISLSFPIAENPASCADSIAQLEAVAEEGIYGSNQTKTVLYIEDNASNVQLVESIFDRRSNVRLVVAMQGLAGLEIARERLPNLILLDLNLPDASGEGILAEIKANPEAAGIPVAIISADG